MMRINVRSRTKFGLVGMLVVLFALLSVTAVLAEGECPGDLKIYIGGPVLDTNAARGTKDNPVANREEAEDLCIACNSNALLYEYDAFQGTHKRYGICSPPDSADTGSPLAQSVIIGLLVLGGLGLLIWGLYTQLRLRRL